MYVWPGQLRSIHLWKSLFYWACIYQLVPYHAFIGRLAQALHVEVLPFMKFWEKSRQRVSLKYEKYGTQIAIFYHFYRGNSL